MSPSAIFEVTLPYSIPRGWNIWRTVETASQGQTRWAIINFSSKIFWRRVVQIKGNCKFYTTLKLTTIGLSCQSNKSHLASRNQQSSRSIIHLVVFFNGSNWYFVNFFKYSSSLFLKIITCAGQRSVSSILLTWWSVLEAS